MSYSGNALSVKIADQLTEMISQHRFQPGDKLPNELELAEELNVNALFMSAGPQRGRTTSFTEPES